MFQAETAYIAAELLVGKTRHPKDVGDSLLNVSEVCCAFYLAPYSKPVTIQSTKL